MSQNPLFSINATLNSYPDIPIDKNPSIEKNSTKDPIKPINLIIGNNISIPGASTLNDFDVLDLETLYLIAIISENQIFIYSFNKNLAQKPEFVSKKVFKSKFDQIESFYCLLFGSFSSEETILACGGSLGFVYILHMEKDDIMEELTSNNGDVYALAFPSKTILKEHSWLLAGYRNGFTLLWDTELKEIIAEFRNFNQNPPSDVSSLDWHVSGDYFVVAHLDTRVIIWEIDEIIKNKALNKKTKGDSVKKWVPLKESYDAHSNYVDCVKFWGNLLVSKDVEGSLAIWTPYKETIFLINLYGYRYYETIWYVKFSINKKSEVICLGNDNGEIFLYKMRPGVFGEKGVKNEGFDMSFKLEEEEKVVRKVIVTEDWRYLFCISDGGKFWWKSV